MNMWHGTTLTAGVITVAAMSMYTTAYSADHPKDTRPAACAGSWYPGDGKALAKLLDGYLSAVKKPELPGEPACLIAPHAGYRFSGQTAAAAFKVVEGKQYSRVILLGPSHHMGGSYTGGAVPTVKSFATPLGNVPLDRDTCDKLIAADFFAANDRPHGPEHCLEIELPLLQRVLKDLRIVPVLLGAVNQEMVVAMAKTIRQVADERTLIVVSTDFTHYGPNYGYVPFRDKVPERLRQLDSGAIDRILAMDRRGFVDFFQQTRATICGRWAVAVALEVFAETEGVEGVVLGYTTSGAMLNDYTNSVSYASIALCRGAAAPLNQAEQECLLKIARDQLRLHLTNGKALGDVEKNYPLTPRLKKNAPAFVTLTNAGQLRGCIGHVVPVKCLYQSVIENTVSACRDHRFAANPVTAKEEPQLHIEVSVLSRFRQIGGIEEIKVGRDGLIMRRGRSSGLLLPQVPTQQGWDREQYLLALCRKAGLPAGSWKDPNTRIYRFTAQVFGEPKDRKEAQDKPQ